MRRRLARAFAAGGAGGGGGGGASPLTLVQSGYVDADDFGRADSAEIGGNWVERNDVYAIASGRIEATAAPDQSACENTAESLSESFVQAVVRMGTAGAGIMAKFNHNGGSINCWFVQRSPNLWLFPIVNGGYGSGASKGLGAQVADEVLELYVADDVQEVWLEGDHTHRLTSNVHNGVAGTAGFINADAGTGTYGGDDFLWCRSKSITVTGLPAGYKAKVRNGGDSVVAQATESDGTATISCSRYDEATSAGTGATERCPLAGWPTLQITDGDDNEVATYTATGVYPGDAYAYAE